MSSNEILPYLTSDETVLEEWKDGSRNIYATNKRLILTDRRRVSDFSYSHISSIDYESKIRKGRIIGGIFLIIIGIIVSITAYIGIIVFTPYFGIIALLIIIIIAIILFLTSASKKTIIYVVGRDPVELSGKMDSLLRWIREYKTAIETGHGNIPISSQQTIKTLKREPPTIASSNLQQTPSSIPSYPCEKCGRKLTYLYSSQSWFCGTCNQHFES